MEGASFKQNRLILVKQSGTSHKLVKMFDCKGIPGLRVNRYDRYISDFIFQISNIRLPEFNPFET
jgi:hypothetical protein